MKPKVHQHISKAYNSDPLGSGMAAARSGSDFLVKILGCTRGEASNLCAIASLQPKGASYKDWRIRLEACSFEDEKGAGTRVTLTAEEPAKRAETRQDTFSLLNAWTAHLNVMFLAMPATMLRIFSPHEGFWENVAESFRPLVAAGVPEGETTLRKLEAICAMTKEEAAEEVMREILPQEEREAILAKLAADLRAGEAIPCENS